MHVLKFLQSVRLTCWRQWGVALAIGVGMSLTACSSPRRLPEPPGPGNPAAAPAPAPAPPTGTSPAGEDGAAPRKVFPPGDQATPSGTTGDPAGEWTGMVRSGLMAVGGETTGMTLTTGSTVFELRATGATLAALQAADGRQVTIKGTRRDVQGVETRRVRRLIDVTAIVVP